MTSQHCLATRSVKSWGVLAWLSCQSLNTPDPMAAKQFSLHTLTSSIRVINASWHKENSCAYDKHVLIYPPPTNLAEKMHYELTFGPKNLSGSQNDQHCFLRAKQHGALFFLLGASSCLRWANLQGLGGTISLIFDGFGCIMARLKADNHSSMWLLLKLSLIE